MKYLRCKSNWINLQFVVVVFEKSLCGTSKQRIYEGNSLIKRVWELTLIAIIPLEDTLMLVYEKKRRWDGHYNLWHIISSMKEKKLKTTQFSSFVWMNFVYLQRSFIILVHDRIM